MSKELERTSDRLVNDATRMQWEKGYLWEKVLSQAFAGKASVRLGEVELDGIVGSPDGVRYEGDKLVVEEYKCTAFSANKPITDMWKWIMQVKGYCHMLGTNRCVFRVLHLSFVPEYRVWELTFTKAELDENWESILNHAKTMELR